MIAGHSAVGDDLALVLALAADPGRGQHPAQALRRPLPTARRRHAALVQVGGDRAHRLPRKQTASRTPRPPPPPPAAASACPPRSRRGGCRHPRPCRSAAISSCLRRMRRLLSSLSFFATAPRIRAWNCPSAVVRSISPLTDATFVNPQPLTKLDERLQLARLPMQTVEVVDQQAVDRPRLADRPASARTPDAACRSKRSRRRRRTARRPPSPSAPPAARNPRSAAPRPSRPPSRSDEIRA